MLKNHSSSLFIENPANGDHFTLWKAPDSITLTDIDCLVDPFGSSETVAIEFFECDSTADNCATVDAPIVCSNTGAADDGSFSNPSIDVDDWIALEINTVTGTVSGLSVTFQYTIDAE